MSGTKPIGMCGVSEPSRVPMGRKREPAKPTRLPLDFYETPTRLNQPHPERCAVTALLARLGRPRIWIDLGAGRGAIGAVLHAAWGIRGIGIEFSEARAAEALATGAYHGVFVGDVADADVQWRVRKLVQELDLGPMPGLAISNPPFPQWEAFELAAMAMDAEQVALLLPSTAFEANRGSRKAKITQRARLLRDPAGGRYDLAMRPAFLRAWQEPDGRIVYEQDGTDLKAYAWRVRGAAHAGRWGFLEVRP
ncbi:hypothetical protein [Polyangium fumosum]|uniref:Uncharacterized protein n=1 Tax=Polyangium fumosum TaxID=889272 RepID=A0A4U1J0C7_9BACT|nr:hypothetical protein [Polyangium fumosum]TKD00422.1 hypothetical protein E8A74_34580 [Polyangium fumosum]